MPQRDVMGLYTLSDHLLRHPDPEVGMQAIEREIAQILRDVRETAIRERVNLYLPTFELTVGRTTRPGVLADDHLEFVVKIQGGQPIEAVFGRIP